MKKYIGSFQASFNIYDLGITYSEEGNAVNSVLSDCVNSNPEFFYLASV